MTDNEKLTSFKTRRELFDDLVSSPKYKGKLFTCPSCGFPTLNNRNYYEICLICNWEDDGQDDDNADEILGGPNYQLSLTASRISFEDEFQSFLSDENRTLIGDKHELISKLSQYENEFEAIVNLYHKNEDLLFSKWGEIYGKLMNLITKGNNA